MTIYYRYGIDLTDYPLKVKMIRDQMKWPYVSGYQAADEIIKLDFYAATTADAVAVMRKRVTA